MRIFGFEIGTRKLENRISELEAQIEQRSIPQNPAEWFSEIFSTVGAAGVSVTEKSALGVPSFYNAVKNVAEPLAALPFDLFQRTPDGAIPAEGHPVRYLIRTEPSKNITSYNFRRAMFARALFSDAFARIHRNGIGRPVRLQIMDGQVEIEYKKDDSGDWMYVWRRNINGGYRETALFPEEVLHIKGLSMDAIKGLEILQLHKSSLGVSIASNQYGEAFFGNNAGVDAVIGFEGTLSPADRAKIENKVESKYSGVKKTGKVMVLDGGMKYEKIGLNPAEAMLNETRNFQVNESSRISNVPSHLLHNNERSTFNNIEVMNTNYVMLGLQPWAKQFEEECKIKLLTRQEKESDQYFFRINLNGLMRGDMKSRADYYDRMLKNMTYTINDVRAFDDLNAVPWGYTPYAQAGMQKVNEDGTIPQPEPQANPPKGQTDNANDNEDEPGATEDNA